ncbi:TauD/TfdA family dioxygenase [Aliikangiella maris]|uniref:TauD/TfdA family dioxygenase n=2 Tax=Aliikangiella maris TaxID=3162458 RepID=A0ABV3MV28_9GAMM
MNTNKFPKFYRERGMLITETVADFVQVCIDFSRELVLFRPNTSLTETELLLCAQNLGEVIAHPAYGPVTNIKVNKVCQSVSIAMKPVRHDYHTDGSFKDVPPREFLLQCVSADCEGGASIFLQVAALFKEPVQEHINALLDTTWKIQRPSYNNEPVSTYIGALLKIDKTGEFKLRWRHDDMVKPVLVSATNPAKSRAAYTWLKGRVDSLKPKVYKMQNGEIVRVPNEYILHGRQAITSLESERHMRRIWIA